MNGVQGNKSFNFDLMLLINIINRVRWWHYLSKNHEVPVGIKNSAARCFVIPGSSAGILPSRHLLGALVHHTKINRRNPVDTRLSKDQPRTTYRTIGVKLSQALHRVLIPTPD